MFGPGLAVAPHWGAWIEILTGWKNASNTMVAPHWGAWIEIGDNPFDAVNNVMVAPHWGAWIEISAPANAAHCEAVAPHWGAWIEILSNRQKRWLIKSHPTGVRGLKYAIS